MAFTAHSAPPVLGLGLLKMLQLLPFQFSISGYVLSVPTAQTLPVEMAATPRKVSVLVRGWLTLGTTLQLLPFQCSISVAKDEELPD